MMRCPERTNAAAPPRKKRKLPPSFFGKASPSEETRRAAAARIQRFVRWRRALAAQLDPIRQEPIPPREAIMLLEAGGAQHWFSASSLASYFVSTARFCNPLSRRPLWCWEINRILLMQPRAARPLIAATYIARFALQKDAHENDGADLVSSVEESLDAGLQNLLSDAEECFFDFQVEGSFAELEEYEDNLRYLARLSRTRAQTLCLRHHEIAKNRGVFCPQLLCSELDAIQEKILMKRPVVESPLTDPMPILKAALLRRLQFQ